MIVATEADRAVSGGPDAQFARRAFVTLFLLLAAQTLTETARDALFLSRLPLAQLPWMYLAVAVVSVLVSRTTAALATTLRRAILPLLLLGSAAVSVSFWSISGSRSPLFLYALYVWPGVFASVVIVEFWRSVSDAYTITEAKRVFGQVGAGGTAGAAAGAALAFALAIRLPATALLLVAALVMTAAFVVSRALPTSTLEAPAGPSESPLTSPLRTLLSDNYLRRVALCLFLATTTATFTDFILKAVLARNVATNHLAAVFAATSFGTNVGALLLQTTLVGPIIQQLGVIRSIAVLPSAVALAAAAVLGGSGLVSAIVLRVTDGTFRYSLHKAIADLLYVPLKPAVRGRVKNLVDVLSQRFGQVIASMAILLVLRFGGGERALAAGVLLVGAAMIGMVLRLAQPYLDLFRTTLKQAGGETRLALPSLDVESLTSLVAAFSSEDDRAVIAAMDLIAAQRRIDVIPVVMLFHPSSAVVLRALELFEQHRRDGFLWALERLRQSANDSHVRAAALSAFARQHDDASILWNARDDGDEIVRITALVDLVAGGWITEDKASAALTAALAEASASGLEAAAAAIRGRPSPLFDTTLIRLATDADLRVRMRVVEAMSRMPTAQFLPALRSMLAESALRQTARETLVSLGQPALDFLASSIGDETLPREIRLQLPRSVSRFEPSEAVPVLWRQLTRESDELIQFKILAAVGHLVAEDARARPSRQDVTDAIQHVSQIGLRFAKWRAALVTEPHFRGRKETRILLIQLLTEKHGRAVEAVFRLLGLAIPGEDFERIYQGMRGSRTEQASGRELLENVVHGSARANVLALLDHSLEPTGERAGGHAADSARTYEAVLAAIVRDATGVLRTVAARHAAESGLAPAA
jgi:AAA family ATP:ADP antiporter